MRKITLYLNSTRHLLRIITNENSFFCKTLSVCTTVVEFLLIFENGQEVNVKIEESNEYLFEFASYFGIIQFVRFFIWICHASVPLKTSEIMIEMYNFLKVIKLND